ncbi:MAG: hypothetical protein ArsCj_4610 [Arsenophonus endosymbiont of Ceratovacuna japonica]
MKNIINQISRNTLILVDGSYYFYRAYYAFPSLTNSIKEPTGAIYGVINMLRKVMVKYKPKYIVVVFDAKGKTFRNELFDRYKSKRPQIPYNLLIQITPLYEILIAMGFPLLVINGVEADDVIGTLALQVSKKGLSVLIITEDKDMAQLVTTNIRLINTIFNIILGPVEITNKYGIPPELIIDLIALMGDSSDNIPGIPGIGGKIALSLLKEIGSLETIYNNLPIISSLKFRGAKTLEKKMIQYKDIAFLSYKLATIKTDVNLNIDHNKLVMKVTDIKKLKILFSRYEFNNLLIHLENSSLLIKK